MCLDKGLHEEDSDDDENNPCFILWLISLQPFINTSFWNTLSLPTWNFISDVYTEKKDIQFTLYEKSTSDDPVTPISLSTDLFIDDSFESSVPADLSFHDVDYLDSFLGNMSSSDISFDNIISPAINWNKYLDPNVDEDDLIEDDLLIDEFLSTMYTECSLPLVPSTFSYPSSPVLVFYDNTSLIFLSNSDDELSDSNDESFFLPFDNETLTYYKTE
ncbi:hypothetical protein GLOIN_2v1814676 [Rhizophagus irregularis DAOM 181602=DAOM 197198]|nr:hypothetical protein GLOIN_2v1814676 [Rhizophagus irregularis DAOM 181602=DAOM 197198]CAG8714666.1 3908_t:CDS:2 [Rhizophagus irregularis]